MNDYTLADLEDGMRVELHPATDAWMQGDRFGEIRMVGRRLVHVYMDRSHRVLKLHPKWIGEVLASPQEWAETKRQRDEANRAAVESGALKFDGHNWRYHGKA